MPIAMKDINPAIIEAEYAVRGAIVAKASELEKTGKKIIYCNIGNPQSLGQKPLTYVKQLLSLCIHPTLIDTPPQDYPSDVIETARTIIKASKHGLGAYSDSNGVRYIREAVSSFIQSRDGAVIDPDAIFLTDGASKGVQSVLNLLISGQNDGIMVPIPQYPLYSATITLYKGKIVPYFLDEKNDWKLNGDMLERAYDEAKSNGIKVKGICIINPGNPTGSLLDEQNIKMTLDFAKKHNLPVLADEVYQDNIWQSSGKFMSFTKMLHETGNKDVSLFSFHSTSKGYLGECGMRGGYFTCQNVSRDVLDQILKLQSIGLCANLTGQVTMFALVHPPKASAPSYELYRKEKTAILNSMKERAAILADGLNKIPGIKCNDINGAMYAFPCIKLPKGVTDKDYCMALVERTGICVVPGSGFGQEEGTAHFRTTILPPTDEIKNVVKLIGDFHVSFTSECMAKQAA